ncbi:MAG: HNH endonuclease [Chloroflexi bacterium]|nr:HNH endonuclease [Chloroflexota bacterium]MYD49210.1 HNH endonuclease [Chloroflexota bacterium]
MADYDSVVARRHNATKDALAQHRGAVAGALADYLKFSGNGSSLQPIPVTPAVSHALETNFDLLDSNGSHSSIRDEILGSAHNGACPYCNSATVDTLDHVLPKTVYPEFSVLAQNLVPSCGTCNRKKGSTCFHSSGLNLMHPYFTKVPNDAILVVDVVVTNQEVTWRFSLQQSASIANDDFALINNTFTLLELADRYSDVSVGEIIDAISGFDDFYADGDPTAVRAFLQKLAVGSQNSRGPNYWKTVILQALADSDAFCAGAYRTLIGKPNA